MSKPGPPQNIRPSSRRGATFLKIRWDPPATNAQSVTHYDVQCKRAKDRDSPWKTVQTRTLENGKLKAVAKDLHSNTHYCFRVKSVNANIKDSETNGEYSEIIEEETRFSLAEKVLLTPAAAIAGAALSPIAGAGAAAASVWVAVDPEKPATKGLTGVASAGAGAAGALAGVVGFPVGAVFGAVSLYLNGYESSWSDGDDDPEPGV